MRNPFLLVRSSSARRFFLTAAAVGALACVGGCRALFIPDKGPDVELSAFDPETPNPLFVKTQDVEPLWDAIVDVMDDYYEIESEAPPRSYEQVGKDGATYHYRTEGRLDTKPSIVGGALSLAQEQRRMRRQSVCDLPDRPVLGAVRVVPEGAGFLSTCRSTTKSRTCPARWARTSDTICSSTTTVAAAAGGRRKAAVQRLIPVGRNPKQESKILQEIGWRAGVARTVLHSGVDAGLTP